MDTVTDAQCIQCEGHVYMLLLLNGYLNNCGAENKDLKFVYYNQMSYVQISLYICTKHKCSPCFINVNTILTDTLLKHGKALLGFHCVCCLCRYLTDTFSKGEVAVQHDHCLIHPRNEYVLLSYADHYITDA